MNDMMKGVHMNGVSFSSVLSIVGNSHVRKNI
jgi:hypothetical protein